MAVIEGKSLPSMNSKKAPPPVEQYDTSSELINLLIAEIVSPPPAIEKAFDCAIAILGNDLECLGVRTD